MFFGVTGTPKAFADARSVPFTLADPGLQNHLRINCLNFRPRLYHPPISNAPVAVASLSANLNPLPQRLLMAS